MYVVSAVKKKSKEFPLEFGHVKGVTVLFLEEHGLFVLKQQLPPEVRLEG